MATKPALLEALGRHSKRSRVTWHSGSIPPYSSLWITIQRLLFLNEPSREAFAKDFLTEAIGNNASWISRPPLRLLLNEYQRASDQNVVLSHELKLYLRQLTASEGRPTFWVHLDTTLRQPQLT